MTAADAEIIAFPQDEFDRAVALLNRKLEVDAENGDTDALADDVERLNALIVRLNNQLVAARWEVTA